MQPRLPKGAPSGGECKGGAGRPWPPSHAVVCAQCMVVGLGRCCPMQAAELSRHRPSPSPLPCGQLTYEAAVKPLPALSNSPPLGVVLTSLSVVVPPFCTVLLSPCVNFSARAGIVVLPLPCVVPPPSPCVVLHSPCSSASLCCPSPRCGGSPRRAPAAAAARHPRGRLESLPPSVGPRRCLPVPLNPPALAFVLDGG